MDVEMVLGSCRLLQRVDGAGRDQLLRIASVKEYQRGATIFRQGDPCPGMFIVGRGLVRVYMLAASGKQHVLHLVGPGMTFAEVAAIGGFDCPAYAEAATDTACLLLPQEPFRNALRHNHELPLQLLESFAGWVRHFLGLVEDITLRDAAGRVARFMLEMEREGKDRLIRLPSLKKDLASRLNLTSETLSRTLRRLAEEGLIEQVEEGVFEIQNSKGLEQVSEGLGPNL